LKDGPHFMKTIEALVQNPQIEIEFGERRNGDSHS
jgi:hypothetical protein